MMSQLLELVDDVGGGSLANLGRASLVIVQSTSRTRGRRVAVTGLSFTSRCIAHAMFIVKLDDTLSSYAFAFARIFLHALTRAEARQTAQRGCACCTFALKLVQYCCVERLAFPAISLA